MKGLIYFVDGKLVAEHNDARVYKMNGELFLEIGNGHTLWAMESELNDYIPQLASFPAGDCLEIGLGLGVASRYILTFPAVNSLTTIELNPNVVAVHEKIKESDRGTSLGVYAKDKHTIHNADGISYAYQTNKKYDFIFIDCYDRIDEQTLPIIADVVGACSRVLRPNGKMIGWLDRYTPEPFYSIFNNIFED